MDDEQTKELAREIFIRAIAQRLAHDRDAKATEFPDIVGTCFKAAKAFLDMSDKAP